MKRLLVLSLTLACLSVATSAFADPIPGIFNTGVNNSNALLNPGDADGHYGGFSTKTDPAWASPGSVGANGSTWITHFNGNGVGGTNSPVPPPGAFPQDTVFTMNFDLTGFDKNTANLSFKFMVDNNLDIKLNGNSIGGTPGGLGAGSQAAFYTTLSALVSVNPAALLAGLNTLTFTVRNNEFIEGLLVSIVSNSVNRPQGAPDPTPEPTSIALWAVFGGLGTVASRWCRKSRKA